jgi:hypothetical protein
MEGVCVLEGKVGLNATDVSAALRLSAASQNLVSKPRGEPPVLERAGLLRGMRYFIGRKTKNLAKTSAI